MTKKTYRYAGLRNVSSPGLSVLEASARLRRFNYIEERLAFIEAAHFVVVPERDPKVLLSRFLYEDARHSTELRQRLKEMRVPKGRLQTSPDEALTVLLDEVLHARGSIEIIAALRWLKGKLAEAYRGYLQATNDLADTASVELIRIFLVQQTEAVALLDEAYRDLVSGNAAEGEAQAFVKMIEPYLEAAGGLDGRGEKTAPVPRQRSTEPYQIKHELARDQSLQRVWDFVAPPQSEVGPHLEHMMSIRLSEINVAEGLAIVLFETPGKPWEFYAAITRHLWDEVRHSLMGEAAIEATLGDRSALPMRDYEGVYCMETSPLEQYATLGLEIEGGNMRYPIGKRGEWEFCRDMAQHPLMTTFQDYDWADEVVHVNIAKQQLSSWFEGGAEALTQFAANGRVNRTAVKTRHSPVPMPVIPDVVERGRQLAGTAE